MNQFWVVVPSVPTIIERERERSNIPTLPPIIMVQREMGVSPIGSFPFKYSHFPLKHDYGGKSTNPAGQKKRPQILLLCRGQDLAMKHGAKDAYKR